MANSSWDFESLSSFVGSGTPSWSMKGFAPGELTPEICSQLASETGGNYEEQLLWFAKQATFKKVISHDGMILQSYFVPANTSSSASKTETVVFCAGWTETSLKYGKMFQELSQAGYDVHSFDIRGQGFSGCMMFNDGPVSHTECFLDYVKDLECFIHDVVYNEKGATEVTYIATSMSTLIGLHSLRRNPRIFKKSILIAPALKTNISFIARLLLVVLKWCGMGKLLLTRFGDEIADIPCTHETENRAAFLRLRKLAPILQVQGCTVSWALEIIKAGEKLLDSTSNALDQHVMVIQGADDTYIDNSVIHSFVKSLSSPCYIVNIPNCYHEVLQETDFIFSFTIKAILNFMERT